MMTFRPLFSFTGLCSLLAGILLTFQMQAQDLPYVFDFTSDPFENGWTSFSVSGDQEWGYNGSFSNVSMSAFAGGCQVNEDWLITPAFDLTSTSDEIMTIDIQRGFAGGENSLFLYYSTNYDGSSNPNDADWTLIEEVTNEFYIDNGIGNNTSVTWGPYSSLQNLGAESVYVAVAYDFVEGSCATWRVAGFSLISAGAPLITASTSAVENLTYQEGEGPSESQSYTFEASNLEGEGTIEVAVSTGFEISSDDVSYGSVLTYAFANGELVSSPATVYVRMVEGLTPDNYTGELTHQGGGASATLPVSGVVTIAPPADSYFINFEGADEVKNGYASGEVVLSGLEWNMTQALIGDLAGDFKNGQRSARLRGYGDSQMTMLQDKENGIGSISFLYRRYGTDQQVPYVVEFSNNAGADWTQIGEEFTGTAEVETFAASVNVAGNIRVRFRTVSNEGSDNRRLNIDDILITDFTGAGSPLLSASPASITGLGYIFGQGPSESTSYTLSASELEEETGAILAGAPTGFELSIDDENWSENLTIPYSDFGGVIENSEIFVRLVVGLELGTYSGEISHSAPGAVLNMAASGSVVEPGPSFNPELFELAGGNYTFDSWDAASGANNYPDFMRFYWSENPTAVEFDVFAEAPGLYDCGYGLNGRSRINGLGAEGFSFLATGSPQWNDCSGGDANEDRYVGSAAIGLNTVGVTEASMEWVARVEEFGERVFGVKLQYRVGDTGPFTDVGEETAFISASNPIGTDVAFAVNLPAEMLGEPEVYARFVYYQAAASSGTRPEIAIDDITVCPCPILSTKDVEPSAISMYPNPSSREVFVQLDFAQTAPLNLRVMDMTGRVVVSKIIAATGADNFSVDLGAIPAGVYLMHLSGDDYHAVGRLVKQQ